MIVNIILGIWILFLLLIISAGIASVSLAPWVPTFKKDLKRIKAMANLKEGETFYELGCGTGRVLFYLARHHPAKFIGLEISASLYFISKIKSWFLGKKRVEIKYKNIFTHDLSDGDVFYVFGLAGKKMQKLKEALVKNARDGSRLISYAFKIEDWEPVRVDAGDDKDFPLYEYVIKTKPRSS